MIRIALTVGALLASAEIDAKDGLSSADSAESAAAALPGGVVETGSNERAVSGWIKSFAAGPVEPSAAFETPEYLGSLIEAAARDELRQALIGMGLVESGADTADLLTFSIKVKEPGPKEKKRRQSPLRLESVDDDPTDNINDPEIRPVIALPTGNKAKEQVPSIEVTIYARRGSARVWSGYAGAPAAGASREDLVRGISRALIAHFGKTVDLPNAEMPLAQKPATPVSEP